MAGIAYLLFSTPRYAARATIRISSYEPLLGGDSEESSRDKTREVNYLDNQLQEVRSRSLADQVLKDTPGLADIFMRQALSPLAALLGRTLPQPSGGYSHPQVVIDRYLDALSVLPVRRSNVVVIEALSPDPSHAAAMANAHAQGYVRWIRRIRNNTRADGLSFLGEQSKKLEARVSDLERQLAEYAEEHSIVAVNERENIVAQRMSQLNKLLTQAMADRIKAEHEALLMGRAAGKNNSAVDDSATQRIREELARVRGEYEQLSAKFTDKYPRVLELKSRLSELERAVTSERSGIVAGLTAKADAARAEELRLQEEFELQKSAAFELSRKQVRYNTLARELESARLLLQRVLEQTTESGMLLQSSATNVSVLDAATIPDRASYPRTWLVLVVALVCGLIGGGAAVGVMTRLDDAVRVPEDVVGMVDLPVLGSIPTFAKATGLNETPGERNRALPSAEETVSGDLLPATFAGAESGSPIIEAYRSLRTTLLLSRAGGPPKILAVTSPRPGEGKTVTALNIAAVLASAGASVVVVDCDLRRPRMGRLAGVPSGTPGVSEILAGVLPCNEGVVCTKLSNLWVVPAGALPPRPAELLGSPALDELLNELAERFDHVVVDTPPILAVTDGELVARVAHGTLLVARSGVTPRTALRVAVERLRSLSVPLLGVVLNDVDVRQPGYYRDVYSGYYGQKAA